MKQSLTSAEKDEIIRKLRERGVSGGCPMCKGTSFAIADGFFNHSVHGELSSGFIVGGPSIPTIAVICTNCGFTSQHALGVLGLLKNPEEAKK